MSEPNQETNESELKQKFVEMRACGESFKKMSEELNVSVNTLVNWTKDLKLEISNLKAVEIDALSVKYGLNKSTRIELIGNIVEKMQKELDNRDYSKIPTDKLFDYLLKYSAELKKEFEPTVFKASSSNSDMSWFETQITWTG